MKNYLLLALLLPVAGLQAQQRITKAELAEFRKDVTAAGLLSTKDPDFTNASAAASTGEAGAVVLCQKTVFEFDKKGISVGSRIGRNIFGLLLAPYTLGTSIYWANANNTTSIIVEERERRRILLKDKASIEEYSILYFRNEAEGDAFDARVIKKDGAVQPVSFEQAVQVETPRSVPDLFRSYTDLPLSSSYRPRFFKVVVPDLQEGDIIEYEFINRNLRRYPKNPDYLEFIPVYYQCLRSLPVERQVIEVVMEDDHYHLGHRSLQGAPAFNRAAGASGVVYRWEDSRRAEMKHARFLNRNLELPLVKFQVVYAKKSTNPFLMAGAGEMNDTRFGEQARNIWFNAKGTFADYGGNDAQAEDIYKQLKKRGITAAAPDDYVRKAYYTLRGITMYNEVSDFRFARLFARLLQLQKLPYEVVATHSNWQTRMSELAFPSEFVWAVRYKDKFYCNPGEHLNPGEVPFHLQGNTAVVFSKPDAATAKLQFPGSDTTANTVVHHIKATVGKGAALDIDETVQQTGAMKEGSIDEVLSLTPFFENDYRNYDGTAMWEGMPEKERLKAEESLNQEKKEWKEEKPEAVKASVEEEYGYEVNGEVKFKVVNDGRSYRKPALTYNQKFSLDEMTAPAGEDLVVALPRLVGGHTQLEEEERVRNLRADVGTPRSLQWNITFTVPAGYTVQGLERLNAELRNSAGAFSVRTTLQGDQVLIAVRKTYFQKVLEPGQWGELTRVLDAAYSWSQGRIVLKKS